MRAAAHDVMKTEDMKVSAVDMKSEGCSSEGAVD